MRKSSSPFHKSAFTLLETAIVIGILSMVLSGGLAIYRVQIVKERMEVTRTRLDDIRKAIAAFKAKNNRLPCPASLTVEPGQPGFGEELADNCNTGFDQGDVANWGTLADGSFRPPAASLPVAGNMVRIGAVPVTSLGLSAEHFVDKWGRRYVYAVSEKLADTLVTNAVTTYDEDTNGGVRLLAQNGSTLGPNPDHTPFVLLSTGKSGQGGYTYEGKPFGTCSGALETENCDFATNATFRTYAYSESETPDDRFDDIVVNNIGNLSGFASDAVAVCGNLGKIYGPANPAADPTNGCVDAGGGGSGLEVPTTQTQDSGCDVSEIGKLAKASDGTLLVCDETPSALSSGSQDCDTFGTGAMTMGADGAVYVCGG